MKPYVLKWTVLLLPLVGVPCLLFMALATTGFMAERIGIGGAALAIVLCTTALISFLMFGYKVGKADGYNVGKADGWWLGRDYAWSKANMKHAAEAKHIKDTKDQAVADDERISRAFADFDREDLACRQDHDSLMKGNYNGN